jgi:hypothetical protein
MDGLQSLNGLSSALLARLQATPRASLLALALPPALALALTLAAPLTAHLPASARKPYATFAAFYPFYLSQHALPLTKLLHCAGTLCVAGFCAYRPPLALALALGALVGARAFPLLRCLDSGLVEMALTLGTYTACATALTGSLGLALALPGSAYFLAWVSHFFVEGNRPATFVYPVFSLAGDFVMFAECLLGRHAVLPQSWLQGRGRRE